ncbi:ATP synthase F1 subunit epsilon [Labilibaculum sp.]|uniref:ATP synthase F1 subunit epsilon n=1 Tax=Labilibaculum sp. TaxID=2060723 RepID=UPI002AA95784|nr:ATP synthase F1 subunit epsilon [Labilibaculum sp.]MBN2598028.1 ATP synthase F1 subunit epsilon [Marinifilaceae bacterium]
MHLEIVTPEKCLYSGEVELVQLPGKNGSFEILKNHAPIVSSLEKGTIKLKPVGGVEIFFEVNGGIVECKKNVISVLADN